MRGKSKLRAADRAARSGEQTSHRQSPSSNIAEHTQRKSPKRSSEDELEVTEVREVKRQRRLYHGAISAPLNDAQQFWEEERQGFFYAFCPSDKTNIKRATKNNYLDRVLYGMHGNRVVEALIVDEETTIPWSVPKVSVEFKSIDYNSDHQPHMLFTSKHEGMPVDPKKLPTVQQMSATEYEEAVARGDPRIAPYQFHTFEHCLDMKLGWLGYRDR